MRLVITDQALNSINSAFDFLFEQGLSPEKITLISEKIFDRIDQLTQTPFIGQKEIFITHPQKEYRRIIESHFKIIYYTTSDTLFITDIFDSRQDPKNMKG